MQSKLSSGHTAIFEEYKNRCTQLQILDQKSSMHEGQVFPEGAVPSETSPTSEFSIEGMDFWE